MSISAPSRPTSDSPTARPSDRHAERQDRGVDAAERDEQDDQRGDDADHLGRAGACVPSTPSGARRRTRPGPRPLRPAPAVSISASTASRPRSAVEPSNCTDANAVVPSGEIDRGLASGSVTASTWSSARTSATVAGDPGRRVGVGDRAIGGVEHDHRGGARALRELGPSTDRRPAWDSTPGTSKLSTVPPPPVRSIDHRRRARAGSRRRPPSGVGGRRSVRDGRASSTCASASFRRSRRRHRCQIIAVTVILH